MSAQQQQQQAQQQRANTKSIGNYILGRTIGEGTFGKVKLGRHILSGANVAVKVLQKDRIVEVADVERVAREVHILKLIRHPHIVQLFEIIETRGQLYLIMEYASGGELFDHIVSKGRVPEPEACRFFHQIIAGVEKIHEMRVVHRDLKPENLLLDEHQCIKIVDFGLSNLFRDGQRLSTACGSPCYAPPEMVAGQQYVPQMCDLWSSGVILFALVCGHLPFEDQNTAALYKKILAADYTLPNFISDAVKDLIAGLLTVDPQKRATVNSVRAHPWYRQVPEASVSPKEIAVNLDEDVLHELEAYGFPRDYAVRCLELNKHNHITTTYYLLLERKRRVLEQLDLAGGGGGGGSGAGGIAGGMDGSVKATSSTAQAGTPRAPFGGDIDAAGIRTLTCGFDTPIPSGAGPDAASAGARTPRVSPMGGQAPGSGAGTPRCDHTRNAQARRISAGVARPNTSPDHRRDQYSARGKAATPDCTGSVSISGVATTPRNASPWRAQQSTTPNPYSARGSRSGGGASETHGGAVAGGAPWPRPQSTTPAPYSARGKGAGSPEGSTATSPLNGSWRGAAATCMTPQSARGSVSVGKPLPGSASPDIAGNNPQWRGSYVDRQSSVTPQVTPRTAFTPRGSGGPAMTAPRSQTPQGTGAHRSPAHSSVGPGSSALPLASGAPGRSSVMSSRRRPPNAVGVQPGTAPLRTGGAPTPRTGGTPTPRRSSPVYSR
mmetsp:Transcript_36947/g.95721  ORF Transcript_36947/g.95721 Transcript_36947/m.95721 type:complete len:720 (-) Transcript_36947:118-2277(-)